MKKPLDGKLLAAEILSRSVCSVKVGAALSDTYGIFSWGWNSSGPSGFGQCAEAHAIQRANKRRLHGATLYVASTRSRNGKHVTSKPCASCQKLVEKFQLAVIWRDNTDRWRTEE